MLTAPELLLAAADLAGGGGVARWAEFLGRFHLVLLHFPFGVLAALGVAECWALARRQELPVRSAVCWAGAVGSVLAAIAGWVWASNMVEADYPDGALAAHRWLGSAVAVAACALPAFVAMGSTRPARVVALIALSALALILVVYRPTLPISIWSGIVVAMITPVIAFSPVAARRIAYRAALVATLVLIFAAGHFGGVLTRGEGFLSQKAPWNAPAAPALPPAATQPAPQPQPEQPAPLAVAPAADAPTQKLSFTKDVWPILEKSCLKCHGAQKQKGKLRLDSREAILAGGKGGKSVEAGQPDKSPLYTRTILPAGHDDIMPSEGDPLPKEQQEILKRWVAEGAVFDGQFAGGADAGMMMAPDAQPQAQAPVQPAGPLVLPETEVDRLAAAVAAPAKTAIAALEKRGARIVAVSRNGSLLDVDCSHVAAFGDEDVGLLRQIGANVCWLDLGGTKVTAGQLAVVAQMPNLTRLHLARTSEISDASLRHLMQCAKLEYLNLVDAPIGDDGLGRLAGHPALRRVYVGGSKATDAGIAALLKSCPEAQVEGALAVADDGVSGPNGQRKRWRKPQQ